MLFCLVSLGLTSCKNKNAASEEGVIYVQETDKDMNAAIDKAGETFQQFENAFLSDNHYVGFVVKEGFPTKEGGKEHMWVSVINYNGKDFVGIVANEPLNNTYVQFGDTITIDKNLISDWMYTDTIANLIHGGYTMRILMDKMSDAEKAAFLEDNRFEFAPIQ